MCGTRLVSIRIVGRRRVSSTECSLSTQQSASYSSRCTRVIQSLSDDIIHRQYRYFVVVCQSKCTIRLTWIITHTPSTNYRWPLITWLMSSLHCTNMYHRLSLLTAFIHVNVNVKYQFIQHIVAEPLMRWIHLVHNVASWRSLGGKFQAIGLATEKVQRPSMLRRWRGTND